MARISISGQRKGSPHVAGMVLAALPPLGQDGFVPTYHLMTQGLEPSDNENDLRQGPFLLVPRRWQVGIWDWALLASEHDLRVPYQIADAIAHGVNLELAVEADNPAAAVALIRALRMGLACRGFAPVSTPTISTHSVNCFSGIKQFAREPGDPRHECAKALVTREEVVWMEGVRGGSVVTRPDDGRRQVGETDFSAAVELALQWSRLVKETPRLRVLEDAALTAPEIANLGQGLLQMWTGLESLFPSVHAELSFRLSLYLAQLDPAQRHDRFERSRAAYSLRSKVAHGHDLSGPTEGNRSAWSACWSLLHSTVLAIINRGELPSEDALLSELLA